MGYPKLVHILLPLFWNIYQAEEDKGYWSHLTGGKLIVEIPWHWVSWSQINALAKWPSHDHNSNMAPWSLPTCTQPLPALRSKPSVPSHAFLAVWVFLFFEGQIHTPSFTHRTTFPSHTNSSPTNKSPLPMPAAGHALPCVFPGWDMFSNPHPTGNFGYGSGTCTIMHMALYRTVHTSWQERGYSTRSPLFKSGPYL